jgi:hypothetical protein
VASEARGLVEAGLAATAVSADPGRGSESGSPSTSLSAGECLAPEFSREAGSPVGAEPGQGVGREAGPRVRAVAFESGQVGEGEGEPP